MEVQMRMAKASKDDIQKTIEFFRFIEEYMEYGTHTPQSEDVEEESIDLSEEQFVEKLRELWGGAFRTSGVDCKWSRVVLGCSILIENCCDPELDYLEWKKEIRELVEAHNERLRDGSDGVPAG